MEMNRREFVKAGACAALAGTKGPSQANSYLIGAYYFPNFHVDARNEQVHGKGWTEWELLKRGEPKFPGHQQPKRPAWGYEDEAAPHVFEKKINAAHSAGLSHFIFDWYWYEGKPFLQRAIEEGYQKAGNKSDVRFCLMWANHDWYNLMPAGLDSHSRPLLYKGAYTASEFDRITDYIVAQYFSDPSYLKIDGSPYFSIYELGNLIERMGGVDVARSALGRFRDKTRAAGFNDLHLNAVAWGIGSLPNPRQNLPLLGVQSVTSYTWIHHFEMQNFPRTEYAAALRAAPAYWVEARNRFGVPYQPDVSMGWDPSPRTCQSDIYISAGYPYTPILVGNSPELFQQALADARTYMDQLPAEPKVLTINA